MKKTATKTKKETKVIDAAGRPLGRVASEAATYLIGKNTPAYERNVFSGCPVRVVNASQIEITEKKLGDLQHLRYSGHPGGLRTDKGMHTAAKKGMKELVRLAVDRMLPKNKLRKEMVKHLTVEN
ncbi:MAG TPA: 50S ribosomal protein L13 [Candidatus Paceibacterota bacterium]|jgi:large subunit ribosomal protein L13|nr:50S ribosomal protein L13 [Candidatus Paceibacterota bacterium]